VQQITIEEALAEFREKYAHKMNSIEDNEKVDVINESEDVEKSREISKTDISDKTKKPIVPRVTQASKSGMTFPAIIAVQMIVAVIIAVIVAGAGLLSSAVIEGVSEIFNR
jgi:predicted phage tail protein